MIKHRERGMIGLVTAAVLWSIGGLFIKWVNWNPLAIASARSGIASLVLLLYLRKPVKRLDKPKLLGACSYASLLILFVTANKLTTAANAILLQFTAPVWGALFCGWFLKEKIHKSDWITIVVVMLGMTLFFIGDLGNGKIIGNMVAVLSGVAFAGVAIGLKLQKNSSPVEMILIGNLITFLIGLPSLLSSVPSWPSISAIVVLGVFQLGISYILYATSVKYVSAIDAILVPVIEPLLNPVWVLVFTGESPGPYAVLGGIVVVAAIVSRGIYQQKRNRFHEATVN